MPERFDDDAPAGRRSPDCEAFGRPRMCRLARPPSRPALLAVVLAGAVSLSAGAGPEPAWASRGAAVIRDCLAHDRITGHYTQKDFRDALAQLPADVDEYSDCRDVIRRAELAAAGGKGGGGGGSAGGPSAPGRTDPLATATPAERAAVHAAERAGSAPVTVGGQLVHPGVVPVRVAAIFRTLPTPLLAGIIALLASALLAAALWGRNLVRARRPR